MTLTETETYLSGLVDFIIVEWGNLSKSDKRKIFDEIGEVQEKINKRLNAVA